MSSEPARKVLKVLMLHGHGQSGSFFFYKTRHIRQAVESTVLRAKCTPKYDDVEFIYPNGALPAGVRGTIDTWAWGYGDFQDGLVHGLEKTVDAILSLMKRHGPFDGIIGFSTGATVTAIIVSLLERGNRCDSLRVETPQPPPRFAICFSGFKLGHLNYQSLYEPQIQTPILHFIPHLDTMITEELTQQLAAACSRTIVQYFEGTHHVPRDAGSVEAIEFFIRSCLNLS
ncbi:serine hydrolase FSH [Aspergillus floccosus]